MTLVQKELPEKYFGGNLLWIFHTQNLREERHFQGIAREIRNFARWLFLNSFEQVIIMCQMVCGGFSKDFSCHSLDWKDNARCLFILPLSWALCWAFSFCICLPLNSRLISKIISPPSPDQACIADFENPTDWLEDDRP